MPPNVISGPVEGCWLIQTEPASSHGGIVVACKHCDHARREYPIGDLGLPERGQLCCWRRFQDHGVAGQDGRDDRPCAEQNRIVPGRDCADDADGAPLGAYMLRGRIAMDRRCEIEIGKAFDEEAGATDPGLRFGRWLALFPRQKVCKHIGISGQGIGDPLTAGGPRFHDLVAPACFTDIPLDGAGGYRRRWPGHDCENAAPVRASAPETIVSMDHWLVINHNQTGPFRRGNHGSRSPPVGPGRPPASPVDQSALSHQQRPFVRSRLSPRALASVILPSFAVVSELRDGRLRNLLPGWNERTGPVSLVWSPLAPRKRRVKSLIGCRAAGFPAWAGAQQA